MFCECGDTPAPIATHSAFPSVRIIVYHPEVIPLSIFQQHQSIGTYTETPVAQFSYLRQREMIFALPVVEQDKVIAGAMVFIKGHAAKLGIWN
jgi:hypothetical protein